jgi:hypothetical protein
VELRYNVTFLPGNAGEIDPFIITLLSARTNLEETAKAKEEGVKTP